MRTVFIDQLIDEAKNNDKIFLLVADLGYSVIEPFVEQFPERFLNVGIAEQNMAGIAAGLAMEGYCVYIYSIGNFPTLRCIEQIRYDICYHNLNVNIVAVGGGYAYGALGPSHHATEEIGMLRTIPNLIVCAPGDPIEARIVTHFSANYTGPCYIRLGKAGEPVIHQKSFSNREIIMKGQVFTVNESNADVAVFSMGSILKYVIEYVKDNNLNASVYSFPFIKPLDKISILKLLTKYKTIITIEEHQANCGFGSALLELINDLIEEGLLHKDQSPNIRRVAIKDKFYSIAGSQEFLRKEAGLSLDGLFSKII